MAELSKQDIERLAADPSAAGRIETAGKLAQTWKAGALTDSVRAEAEKLLRLLAKDAIATVRQALSDHLKDASQLPEGLAMTLAKDIDAVALPLLIESRVFSDEDLIEIVASQGPEKQVAVASRSEVSDAVSMKLVEHGDARVAATLAANEGARMSDATVERLVDRHGKSGAVQEKLAVRKRVPLRVLEKLYNLASERIRETAPRARRHDQRDGDRTRHACARDRDRRILAEFAGRRRRAARSTPPHDRTPRSGPRHPGAVHG